MTEYYTVDIVAHRFAVHPKTVRRWIAEGKLPAVRVGHGHWRILKMVVDAMLQPHTFKKNGINGDK
jgi:excisionase family DNA binding protein